MELKRKIDDVLIRWKNESKTALLLLGARQIGKTYAIRKLGKSFASFIEINFADHPELVDPFSRIMSPEDLLIRISLIPDMGGKMIEGKTLIFLDEIQLVYRRREELKESHPGFVSLDILTAMKRMSEEGKYRFALSGSLLGATVNDIGLYPAGYMEERTMYPLDFEEYLWARGIGSYAIDHLRDCFISKTRVEDDVNESFLRLYREYVLVGGMPLPVSEFIERKNLHLADIAQRDIIEAYKRDITTYVKDEGKKLIVKEIYARMPSELDSKNKRFVFSHALDASSLRNDEAIESYLWLTSAGVAIPVYNVKEPKIPLSISSERKTLKLFMNDVGLLSRSLFHTGIREKLLSNEQTVNYGAPYENAAAEELCSHGYDGALYYYNSKRNGEVDFLVETSDGVMPIEIKSGKMKEHSYYNHSALNKLVSLYGVKEASVFGESNLYKETEVITVYPSYMIGFVSRED